MDEMTPQPIAETEVVENENSVETVEDALVEVSQDIRTDLEDVLSQKLQFDGTYATQMSFEGAPMPGLTIEGLGQISLPLYPADAKRIIEASSPAPFGHGEKTVYDKAVRDTWEIEPEKISFGNSSWEYWINNQVLPFVCRCLGLYREDDVESRCELYKLLLYEEGSHFLAHQDTEKAPAMFATMLIVLPSGFSGGAVEVAHGVEKKSLDVSEYSGFRTSVLAWYTDVKHSVKPITSGYRLALSYNLIHPTGHPLPSILPSNMISPYAVIHHILLSWKQNAKATSETSLRAPDKLGILLDHQYSASQFSINALKGSDVTKLCALFPVAQTLDFNICFASLDYHLRGEGDDDTYDSMYHGEDYDDERHIPFHVEEKEHDIGDLKDQNGRTLYETFEEFQIDEAREMIPCYGLARLEDVEADKVEYDGYMGNGSGKVDNWYHRMMLILWPKSRNAKVLRDLLPVVDVRVTTRTSRVHSRSPSPSGEPNERSRSAEQDEIEHHAYRVDHKTDDGSRKHAFHPYGR